MKNMLESNHSTLLELKNLYEELRNQMLLEHKNNLRNIVLFKAVINELRNAFPESRERISLHINKTILSHADDENQCAAFKEALAIAES